MESLIIISLRLHFRQVAVLQLQLAQGGVTRYCVTADYTTLLGRAPTPKANLGRVSLSRLHQSFTLAGVGYKFQQTNSQAI